MARLATDVRVFRHTDGGAPQLKGAAGSLVSLLTACLVNGYNELSVSSLTRSGSTVTVTTGTAHGFPVYAVVNISGAVQSEYNGDHRIETVPSSTTFAFTLPDGVLPATPATGTITVKMASAGWERSFVSGDGNRAVFRSTDPQRFGFYLYVDDTNTWTRRAGAKGYESVTGIDARVNPFPWSASDDQWVWWYKSDDDDTARQWALVADSRMFYLWVNYNNNNGERLYAFGDLIPLAGANDPFCTIVQGNSSATDTSYAGGMLTITKQGTTNVSGCHFARDVYGAILGQKAIALTYAVAGFGAYYSYDMYPDHPYGNISPHLASTNPHIGGFPVSPVMQMEDRSGMVLRGQLPGLFIPLQNLTGTANLTTFAAADKTLLVAWTYASRGTYNSYETGPRGGYVAFDIIGPWR